MPFSRKQHFIHFRPMVDKAWQVHCDLECITDSTAASKRDWYEAILRKHFGVASTKELNASRHFDLAMAVFEELADDGIHWQMNAVQGDARRARFKLDETVSLLRLTDHYIAGIMAQMGITKVLRQCSAEELLNLRLALLYHVRRKQERTLAAPR